MKPASITQATPGTLPRSGQGSDDATAQGGKFDAVLADVTQSAVPAAAANAGAAASGGPPSPATPRTKRQDVHTLLAQISVGSAALLPVGKGAPARRIASTGPTSVSDAAARPKSAEETKDAAATDVAPTNDAAADMRALAVTLVANPGALAAPARTSPKDGSATPVTTRSGPTGAPEPPDAPVVDAAACSDVAVAIVGTANYLAPVSIASAGAHATADAASTTTAKDAGTSDAALPDGTLQTIADGVAALADEAAGTPGAPAKQTTPQSTYVAPARSLTLQLSPGTLGSVTVHLHMTGGALDLHLAVENNKTLGAIARARDELIAAIGDSGYKLDSLTIRSADPSSAMAGSNDPARNDTQSGGGAFADDSGRRGSGGDGAAHRQRSGGAAREPAAARDRGGDGVFV